MALKDEVRVAWKGDMHFEESPANDAQSNGAAEAAGRIVRDFARVLKAQIEEKAQVLRLLARL